MAELVPCGQQLRAEFDEVFPHRDRSSDGWIADGLHSSASHHTPDESSKVLRDHDADSKNEVHAIDVDEDLRDGQTTMAESVDVIWQRHRGGLDNRVTEIIYEGRIATAARDWIWRPYSGANPHDKHAHFSFSYLTARENDRRPFGVAELARREDDEMKDADWARLEKMLDASTRKVWDGRHIPALGGITTLDGKMTPMDVLHRIYNRANVTPEVLATLRANADRDMVDEEAIARAVLAGLGSAAIVAAIPENLAQQVADELAARLQG